MSLERIGEARKRTAYLAGPMRGLPEYNFPQFHKAAAILRKLGWAIISPAEMDEEAGEHVTEGHKAGQIIDQQGNRRIVRRDLEAILSLRSENNDAIIVLPDWYNSTGTNAEVRVGKWLGLELYQLTWDRDAVILKDLEL